MDKTQQSRQIEIEFAPARKAGEALPGGCLHRPPGGQAMKVLMDKQTIEVFGKPFSVDWQSNDHRLIASRENKTCYELVSFGSLKSEDDDTLRRGTVVSISRETIVLSPDFRKGFGVVHSVFRPRTEDERKLAIANEVLLHDSGRPICVSEELKIAVCVAQLDTDSRLSLKEVVQRDVPNEARAQWQLASLLDAVQQAPDKSKQTERARDINATLIWHIEQRIEDELDNKSKATPTHRQVFIRYCRDRMQFVQMQRKFCWKYRTVKARKAALKKFLWKNFKLTLESFFVDRRIFTAAERELKKVHDSSLYRRSLVEVETDDENE